jgi:hypothetical protein
MWPTFSIPSSLNALVIFALSSRISVIKMKVAFAADLVFGAVGVWGVGMMIR